LSDSGVFHTLLFESVRFAQYMLQNFELEHHPAGTGSTDKFIDVEEIETSQASRALHTAQEPSKKCRERPCGSRDKQTRKRMTREKLTAAKSHQEVRQKGDEVEEELLDLPDEE